MRTARVHFQGRTGFGLREVTSDLRRVSEGGVWFVAATFEGDVCALRFEQWLEEALPAGYWPGATGWVSDKDESTYCAQVEQVREAIAAGDVYQVNLCRQLSAPWPPGGEAFGLAALLARGNPAPYAAVADLEDERLLPLIGRSNLRVVSASPELFVELEGGQIRSAPIKGTVAPGGQFLEKDSAENVMIVDLVRNDLSAVCATGTLKVERLLERVSHPGLDHLVSTVAGQLSPSADWADIFAAAFPPGSVSGAPKSSALKLIQRLESPRSFYCGALGVIDADAGSARLNVAIRTFWQDGTDIKFGTGAGITWGSDPKGEWLETELKAAKLISIASRSTDG